jgi:chromosome segregation ATPase
LIAPLQEIEGKRAEAEQRLKQRETELQAEINRLNDQMIDLVQENGEKQKKVMESETLLKTKKEELDQLTMRNQMIGGTLGTTRKKFEEFKTLHAQCNVTQQAATA